MAHKRKPLDSWTMENYDWSCFATFKRLRGVPFGWQPTTHHDESGRRIWTFKSGEYSLPFNDVAAYTAQVH